MNFNVNTNDIRYTIRIVDYLLLQEIMKLKIKDLKKLCRDFASDCYMGYVSNDKAYIENWVKKNVNNKKPK